MSITIGTWEETPKVNPYVETIDAMIKAGENAAATITIDTKHTIRERNAFSKAANMRDKTARVRLTKDLVDGKGNATGKTEITFTLTARHKARRGKADNA